MLKNVFLLKHLDKANSVQKTTGTTVQRFKKIETKRLATVKKAKFT